MRRLYDNEGNIAAGVARQLRYERPHGRVAPPHDQAQIGPITALFGLVAAGFILLVLVVGFFALLGYLADRHFMAQTQAQQKKVYTEENSDLPRQVIETRTAEAPVVIPAANASTAMPQYAVSVRIQQPQVLQQVVEVPESPVPAATDADAAEGPLYTEDSNEGSLSWRWVCSAPAGQNPRCSLRDPNGNYLQTFEFAEHGLVTSEFSRHALRPRSWGCERTIDEKLYCTIQDGRGQILQCCVYDGKTLSCGTEPGSSPALSNASEQESPEPEYLPSEYDIGCLKGIPFGWMLVYEHIPHGYADGRVDRMPEGTCLLVERANINGYRRVVSFDAKYAGYAQIWPSPGNPQTPKPMQPGYEELIARLRRIP